MPTPPCVTIILALCDGASYLEAQLQSYVDQTLLPVRVLASDDRPGDGTGNIFQEFAAKATNSIQWDLITGPQKGLTANFLYLLAQLPIADTEFVALSDQDDIWLPEKLHSALAIITKTAGYPEQPILLGTRSWEWTEETNKKRLSRPIPTPYDFRHALMQNYAGGNTMVLNRAALRLVQRALPGMPVPAMHDWWLYQIIAGAGGTVLLDTEPRLLYRQHLTNQVGANATLKSNLSRFSHMLTGTYRQWMNLNLATLQSQSALLSRDNSRLLARLAKDRDATLLTRLRLLAETGLHRKGCANQIALWIAAALRRM